MEPVEFAIRAVPLLLLAKIKFAPVLKVLPVTVNAPVTVSTLFNVTFALMVTLVAVIEEPVAAKGVVVAALNI